MTSAQAGRARSVARAGSAGSAAGAARPAGVAGVVRPLGSADEPPQALVSRAGEKLRAAAQAFHYDFRGKTVLDIGSSTGGFTQYALRQGAAKVIAVERGTRQMQTPLRLDPRIELHEKTDIFDFTLPPVDTILADVSFTPLTKVLKYAKMGVSRRDTDWLVMLKPQFEAAPEQLVRGVVKNEKLRRGIIRKFESWLRANGFLIINKRDNQLTGKAGNRERFYWLRLAR